MEITLIARPFRLSKYIKKFSAATQQLQAGASAQTQESVGAVANIALAAAQRYHPHRHDIQRAKFFHRAISAIRNDRFEEWISTISAPTPSRCSCPPLPPLLSPKATLTAFAPPQPLRVPPFTDPLPLQVCGLFQPGVIASSYDSSTTERTRRSHSQLPTGQRFES